MGSLTTQMHDTFDLTGFGTIEMVMELPTPEWMLPFVREAWDAETAKIREGNDRFCTISHPAAVHDHDWATHDISRLNTKRIYSSEEMCWGWYWEYHAEPKPIYISIGFDPDEDWDTPSDSARAAVPHYAKKMAYAIQNVLLHPERLAVE